MRNDDNALLYPRALSRRAHALLTSESAAAAAPIPVRAEKLSSFSPPCRRLRRCRTGEEARPRVDA